MNPLDQNQNNAGYADLRRQIAALICDDDVPENQIGTLPDGQMLQRETQEHHPGIPSSKEATKDHV